MSNGSVHASVALKFATALVAGDFAKAHAMLTPALTATLSPDALESQYREMVSYFSEAPSTVQVVNTLEEWPDKQPGDLGWAYAAIWGDEGSEAVTVVVTGQGGRPAIRSIEWGRP